MGEPVKLSGVSTVRKQLANGRIRTYYRHRASGTMLGNSDDLGAVFQKYARINRPPKGQFEHVPEYIAKVHAVAPRLVTTAVAAAYCSLRIEDFNTHIRPRLHKLRFGDALRYDLREIDFICDEMSAVDGSPRKPPPTDPESSVAMRRRHAEEILDRERGRLGSGGDESST